MVATHIFPHIKMVAIHIFPHIFYMQRYIFPQINKELYHTFRHLFL